MKLADIKRGEKHRPPPCEPFLHETLFRPLFHRGFGQRTYKSGFDIVPLPNFCSASLYLDISYRVKPQLLENIGVHIIQKCGLRVQKQVVKEVQMLVQHMGATLVHWISTDALVQHWCSAAATLFSSVKDRN